MRRFLDHSILCVGVFILVAPLLLVFIGAFADGGLQGLVADAIWSFDGFQNNLSNLNRFFGETRAGPSLQKMFFTSAASATGVAIVTTVSAFLAAYSITFLVRSGARFWFFVTLLTLYFPIEARMLPTFDVAARLGLINTVAGLVLPVLPLAMATFIFRQTLHSLPPELQEAARIDGAGPIKFMWDFVIPLSLGPIGVVFVITFIVGWNQYLWPLMISIDNSLFPLMRGLNLAGSGSGPSMVLATISMLPPLVLLLGLVRLMSTVTAVRM